MRHGTCSLESARRKEDDTFMCCQRASLMLCVAPACAQVFAGLLVGAMLPYWFSAMTMKSVGKAALAMVEEVRRQFNTIPGTDRYNY